jgi:hypothetical protein
MRGGCRENERDGDGPGRAGSDQVEFATIVVHVKGFRTATPVGS